MCVYMYTHTVTYFTPEPELVIPTTSCVLVSDTGDTCTVASISKCKGNVYIYNDILRTRLRVSENNNILGSCFWHLRHMYTSTYAHMQGECVHIYTPWHTSHPTPSYQTQQSPWCMSLTLETLVQYGVATICHGVYIYSHCPACLWHLKHMYTTTSVHVKHMYTSAYAHMDGECACIY